VFSGSPKIVDATSMHIIFSARGFGKTSQRTELYTGYFFIFSVYNPCSHIYSLVIFMPLGRVNFLEARISALQKYYLLGGLFGYVIIYNLSRFYNIFKKARILY